MPELDTFMSVADTRRLLDSGDVTSEDLTGAHLARIATADPQIAAFTTLSADLALDAARHFDFRRAAGQPPISPLDGVPMSLKDVLITRGVRTTCGSRHLYNFVPPFNGTVPQRLADAGAVLLGKTNCDEFAMGSSTENSAWGPTRNPWDHSRVPGGSSGGSAAAVAAGMGAYSLGTDTGGSVRQPASLCGVTGLKPTYGRVSRYGLVAFASSLDQIGPFTHSAYDAALVMQVIAGHDPLDSTSQPVAVPPYTAPLDALDPSAPSLKGLRIGIPAEFWGEGLHPAVSESVREAIDLLRTLGADLREVSLPNTPFALATYYIIAPAEASANLARYDGMKYGYRDPHALDALHSMLATRDHAFGPEVKRRIMLGTYALSAGYYDAFYKKAQQVRTLIAQDYSQAFQHVDALVGPTSPSPAFPIGDKVDDPLAMYLNDVYTVPANLAGIPGISIPCGNSEFSILNSELSGSPQLKIQNSKFKIEPSRPLPIGLQLLANHFHEPTLLRIAHAFQLASQWHLVRPETPNAKRDS